MATKATLTQILISPDGESLYALDDKGQLWVSNAHPIGTGTNKGHNISPVWTQVKRPEE